MTFRSPWQQRLPWLLALVLVVTAGGLLLGEMVAVEVGFLIDPMVGAAVLWVLGPLGAAAVGTVAYRAVTGRSLWGDRRPRWSDVGWGVLAGLLVLGLDVVIYTGFDLLVPDPGAPVQGWIDDAMMVTPWLVAAGVALATPFGEEVVFRGLLLRGLAAPLRLWPAVVVSSALFGLVHLENLDPAGLVHVVSAGLAGAIFALAVLRTGHLVAGVVAHLVVNTPPALLGALAGGLLVWTVGPDGDVPVVDLEVGACAGADWWDGEPVTASTEVSCDEPHDIEVAYRGDVTGAPWARGTVDAPGVADAADDRCIEEFDAYVGSMWEFSELDVLALLPSTSRWDDGERELICLVVPWEDDRLNEPARDSGR